MRAGCGGVEVFQVICSYDFGYKDTTTMGAGEKMEPKCEAWKLHFYH